MRRIYVTREAYRALVEYCLSTRGTLRGMAHVASGLLVKAIRQELAAAAEEHAQPQRAERRPQPPPPPPPPPPVAEEHKPSKLDDLEDCTLIRPRNLEAFLRACSDRGLQVVELSDLGAPGLYLIATRRWIDFVATAAAGDRTPPSKLEQLAREAVKDGAKRLSPDEKYALTLFILNRQGELLWDGEKWKPAEKKEE